jgi:hypothetical protein
MIESEQKDVDSFFGTVINTPRPETGNHAGAFQAHGQRAA